MLRLDRLLTLYAFDPLGKLNPTKNPAIPILMYHSVSNEPETGHPYFWANTSSKRFTEHMHFLKENDYKVISLTDAVKLLEDDSYMTNKLDKGDITKPYSSSSHVCKTPVFGDPHSTPCRYVVLTFDDGYYDFLKHAWTILENLGFRATIFVSTAFIGKSRKYFNGRQCLTWSEIRELHSHGVSFGSHTVSHSKLYGLKWKEVRRELLDSRLRLEDELQMPVPCFAYPYAFPQEDRSFVLHFRQELVDQGYRTAVTTTIGLAQRGSDPLCLKRLPMNEGDDRQLFKAKLVGAYNWLSWPQRMHKRLKSISARKDMGWMKIG